MTTKTYIKLDLRTLNQYRKQASIISKHIQSYKDDNGIIQLDKDVLHGYCEQISVIMKECSSYLDKCGLTMPPPLWKYDIENPKTQPSSVAFIYKDRMTKKQIKAYGKGFMSEPLKPKKEDEAA